MIVSMLYINMRCYGDLSYWYINP